jgi:2-keto-3-deoxy-L-fuconate dehydrogenase
MTNTHDNLHIAALTGRLEGKRALVTAAANGIGRAIAERLAAEGAHVVAADIDGARLKEIEKPAIEVAKIDFSDPKAVTGFVEGLGQIDVLVNCVGWVHQGDILSCTYQDWKRSFAINVDSTFLTIKATLAGMVERGSGSIINIASVASSVKAVPNRVAYAASKAGVIGLTKAVAIDVVKTGVRCNAICPGTVASPSLEQRISSAPDPVKARADFIARQPMGRLGEPEEIAGLAAYLAADESRFITGSITIIDGGMAA